MRLNLIGVPIYYGCDREGVQYGPKKLRENNISDIFREAGLNVIDLGDIQVDKIKNEDRFKDDKNIKYYSSIYKVNNNLAQVTYDSVKSGNIPIILGGDHSIALGSISGVSRHFKNLGIVWIDAHGDFNTEEISESKNYHGMPLASLAGFGKKNLVDLYYEGKKIKEENIFHIGARDLNIKEEELIRSTKVNLYDKVMIDNKGFDFVLEDIVKKCIEQKIDAIHISLDIDFMDKDLVPGTGTRVEGGYTLEDTRHILDKIISTNIVKSMDFVEFNPIIDEKNTTLDVCIDLLNHIALLFSSGKLLSNEAQS